MVWERVGLKENQVGLVDRLLAFVYGSNETAGLSSTLPRISWTGNTGSTSVGMTKLRAVAHLGMSGGGWTESKELIWTRLVTRRQVWAS